MATAPQLGTQATGTPAALTGAAQQVWDFTGSNAVGQPTAPDQEFSELVAISSAKPEGSKAALYLLLALVALAIGWFAFETFVAERDPVATLAGYVDMLFGNDTPEDDGDDLPAAPPAPAPVAKPKAPPAAPKTPAPVKKQTVDGNPYWALPNGILGARPPLKRAWAPEEEETLRAGLAHPFTYQRFKTVQDIRARRLFGSEAALWDALQDKKFWTRMYAAIGLAEFNVEVSLQTLETALAGARSELVADFFERCVRKPQGAELFIIRQVIRLLDEKGRLVALQAIHRSKDALRDLYLVAATQDPGPKVRAWIARVQRTHSVTPARRAELLGVVDGSVDGNYLLTTGKAPTPRAAPKTAPISVATEADLERQLKEFEETEGDVEFYDGTSYQDTFADEGVLADEEELDAFEYDE